MADCVTINEKDFEEFGSKADGDNQSQRHLIVIQNPENCGVSVLCLSTAILKIQHPNRGWSYLLNPTE
jgi:hypothetical protein